MADPAHRPRSFEELYAEIERLPEGMTGEILEDGVLRVTSRPGKRHRRAAGAGVDALSGVDDERRVLPPFEIEISLASWWLPGPPPTE
jgi:hypothetical protein